MRQMAFPITVLFASVTASAVGQAVLPDSTIRLSLESELRDTVGSEAETRSMIQDSIAEWFAVRGSPTTAVTVIAEQLPEAWLPRTDGVRFVRLPLVQAQDAWKTDCLRLFWVGATVTENTLTVTLSEGDRCRSGGTLKRFERSATGWKSQKGGGGFGGFAGVCPCSK
jgi:hypothetical protein